MTRENKQIEDVIIAEAFIKVRNTLALFTIVGLSCWVGYLLSCNEQKAITIEMYERSIDSANVINQSVHERDSITISQMPSKEELDWFYNFKNK